MEGHHEGWSYGLLHVTSHAQRMMLLDRNSPITALDELNNPFCLKGDDVVVVDMNCGGLSGIDNGGWLVKWSPRSPLWTKVSSMVGTGSVAVDSSICRRPVGLKVCTRALAIVRGNLVETRLMAIIADISKAHHVTALWTCAMVWIHRSSLLGNNIHSSSVC